MSPLQPYIQPHTYHSTLWGRLLIDFPSSPQCYDALAPPRLVSEPPPQSPGDDSQGSHSVLPACPRPPYHHALSSILNQPQPCLFPLPHITQCSPQCSSVPWPNQTLPLILTLTIAGNERLDSPPSSTTAQHSVVTVSRTVGWSG